MFYPFFYDSTYVLVMLGAILSIWASHRVNATFAKYDRVRSMRGITGAEAARRILSANGITNVSIHRRSGNLTDCYVPSKKELYLSDSTYDSCSIAAIGVAAHECGHAIQDAVRYVPLTLSNAIHPACAIGSNLGIPITIMGILLSMRPLILVGIVLFGLGVLISLVTLPVEYNASNRALAILENTGILSDEELVGTKKVLRAAGLTYVAAAAAMILNLLRLLLLARRDDN